MSLDSQGNYHHGFFEKLLYGIIYTVILGSILMAVFVISSFVFGWPPSGSLGETAVMCYGFSAVQHVVLFRL